MPRIALYSSASRRHQAVDATAVPDIPEHSPSDKRSFVSFCRRAVAGRRGAALVAAVSLAVAGTLAVERHFVPERPALTQADIDRILTALDSGDYGAILRAKGIVPAADGQWLHFDYVPQEHEVRYGAADYTGRLCVIGSQLKEDGLKTLFGL